MYRNNNSKEPSRWAILTFYYSMHLPSDQDSMKRTLKRLLEKKAKIYSEHIIVPNQGNQKDDDVNNTDHATIERLCTKFFCTFCGKSIINSSTISHYEFEHTEKRYFQCNLCSVTSYNLRLLRLHVKVCHRHILQVFQS